MINEQCVIYLRVEYQTDCRPTYRYIKSDSRTCFVSKRQENLGVGVVELKKADIFAFLLIFSVLHQESETDMPAFCDFYL